MPVPGALTRWEPFTELADLRSRFDRAFDDMLVRPQHTWTPAIDVERREDALLVRADVPGYKPENVKIEIEDDVLTLYAEREEEKEVKDKDYVRRERRYGAFSRSMTLPAGVDPEQVDAVTHDGVLEVTIPLPKAAEKRTVTITPTAS